MVMKISIIGAGPAGLYAAILIKRLRPDINIRLIEQNAANVTWGFGVVFSDRALDFLKEDDPETAELVKPVMQHWDDIAIVHRGERVAIDGVGFRSIGRLEFLLLLQKRAIELGIEPEYDTHIDRVEDAGDVDLVIGADGLNSIVRAQAPEVYGENLTYLNNRFVWYGASKAFDVLTQTFKSTKSGPFNAHHYRYAQAKSTFIIECSEQTFKRVGFGSMSEPDYRQICEEIFSDELDGASLIANNSIWRRFPVLRCSTWHHTNRVLVGDALHTAHFSIGSGTRLALEDVVALVKALESNDYRIEDALPAYQAARQPILDKLTRAAGASAEWYEHFSDHMALAPWPFALSYIMRAQRLDFTKLQNIAPQFASEIKQRNIIIPSS